MTAAEANLSPTQRRRMESLRAALGPIVGYLEDSTVVEIMRNPDGSVWVEHQGSAPKRVDAVLSDPDTTRFVGLVAAELGVEISASSPSLAAKLPGWGARLQATVPPVVEAPCFCLRMPPKRIFTLHDYVKAGTLSADQAQILKQGVLDRRNILVAGSTGSGKTTLINALLHALAGTQERIVLIEDTPELQCAAENRVGILVQPPLYTWQRAIMDVKRQRPDRIVLGEVRDGAALEMIKAWNSGHPGMCTIHSDSAKGALDQLCMLIEEVVPSAPRGQVARTVDIVVHIKRDSLAPSGRSITSITEVLGMEGDEWQLRDATIQPPDPTSEATLINR